MYNWKISFSDDKFRVKMSYLLRIGVFSSALMVLFGGTLFFIQHPFETFNYSVFKGEPERLKHVNIIFKQAIGLRSRAVIQLGIIILMATPVARVVYSFLGFLLQKDWIYVSITFIVLMILFYSLFIF